VTRLAVRETDWPYIWRDLETVMCRLILFCLSVLLIACAGPSKTILPGGEEGYEITCSGSTWESCHKKAEALCAAAGYQVLRRYEDYSRRSIPRSMLISCNPPPTEEPLEYSPEASLQPFSEGSCCADLEKLAKECAVQAAGSHCIMLSDPLEIALIEAVRSALPRNELEALVRMMGKRAPAGSSGES
jgi:hypothetical protein